MANWTPERIGFRPIAVAAHALQYWNNSSHSLEDVFSNRWMESLQRPNTGSLLGLLHSIVLPSGDDISHDVYVLG